MVGVVGHPLPGGAEPRVAAKDTKVGASPWQGSTWADGCIFPKHFFVLCLLLFPHLRGDVTYQKAEKDFFAAALPFLSVWHQHLAQVPKDHA